MKSFSTENSSESGRTDLKTIRKILPFLWPGSTPLRLRVISAMTFLLFAKALNVLVPIILKEIIDDLNSNLNLIASIPVALVLAYGATRLLSQIFNELRDAIFTRVAQRAVRLAGRGTFNHLHRLSVKFHLNRKTGGVSRAIERGTKGIEFLLRFLLFNVLPTVIEVLLVSAILWKFYGYLYALIAILTLLTYIAWTLCITEWRIKFRRLMNESDNEANTRAVDSLLNFETVKYFCNEDYEVERYDDSLKRYENAAVKSGASLAFLNIGQGLIVTLGLITAMILASLGVVSNTMTLGDFVLINTYMIQLYLPLNFLGFVYREIKRSLTDMESMFELLNAKSDITIKPGASILRSVKGEVAFDNVSFCYDENRNVLKDVSFKIMPGQKIAIVGPSGSGKSTIARLLLRFYDVLGGRILVDSQDVRDITEGSLRTAIGIVPQDTVLFNESIYYNIAYGCPSATAAEVQLAAKMAYIHKFVAGLPGGYSTIVGERGLKLSGGEKQRIAIARTILKNPQILILDEATSALDSQTEQEILEALSEISKDRTTLSIAHRLSTIIDSDEILVLDQGKIVEHGPHSGLIAQNGVYASMWSTQKQVANARELLKQLDN